MVGRQKDALTQFSLTQSDPVLTQSHYKLKLSQSLARTLKLTLTPTSMATPSTSALPPTLKPLEWFNSIGSPAYTVAPMVDQSELVSRSILSHPVE